MNLGKNVKITQVLAAKSVGVTDYDSDIIDMSGYDGVLFIALFSTIIAAGTIKLSADQNTANSSSGMAELAGATTYTTTAADATAEHKAIALDIYKPEERYLRASLDIATENQIIGGIVAIQYCGSKAPANTDDLMNLTTLISPAEA